MIKKPITINLSTGLEARPVAQLVQVASQFNSEIYVEIGKKRVNAKSIMGMMTLGLDAGEEITLSANGEDEEADRAESTEIKVESTEKPSCSHPEYPNVTDVEYDDIYHMNEEAIGKLHEQGDVNENERPIQHTVTFKNQEDMENFKNKIVNKGFVVTKGVSDYDLTVLHISSIDSMKLMENVLFIADQAYANHGSYKGWQSKISY